jgi:hypothetical protein
MPKGAFTDIQEIDPLVVRCVRLVIYRSTERDALCKATIGTQDLTVNPAAVRAGKE